MDVLKRELNRRWQAIFAALAGGDDVPPTQRLRTEGIMESVVLQGQATATELQDAMDACYRAAFGRGIADDCGDDWQEFFPFPQIPAMGRRAPVYPSTSE